MKRNIVKFINYFFRLLFKLRCFFYSKKNSTLLLYTDSRGTIVETFYKQRNPFFSYLKFFDEYKVSYQFCPHKFTSILDFLNFYENCNFKFDIILLHCGIVDFAPRPVSSYESMLKEKKEFLIKRGWLHYFEDRKDFLCDYEGEKTLQFMSIDFLNNEIIPELKKINNLIYIGINPVLHDWIGNYWRARPSCINLQLNQNELMMKELTHFISLSDWSAQEIKLYTVDNVHYNKKGLEYIGSEVLKRMNAL